MVADFGGFHDEWTGPLEPGTKELLSERGDGTRNYQEVATLFGCPILRRKRFELAVNGKFFLTTEEKTTGTANRTLFVNLDDFTVEGQTIPKGGSGYDVQSRLWLAGVVNRIAAYHVATYLDQGYEDCFQAVHDRLKGEKNEESSIQYLGGNIEMALGRFYAMAAGNRTMSTRWRGPFPAPTTHGYHRHMAGQLKAEIDFAMSERNLKHMWPHEQFFRDSGRIIGQIGGVQNKHGAGAGTGSGEGAKQVPTPVGDARSTKRKREADRARNKAQRQPLQEGGGTGNGGNSSSKSSAEIEKPRSGPPPTTAPVGRKDTKDAKAEQPCMKQVLFTTGLEKEPCPRGAECRFAHWTKGKIGEKDISGSHWGGILEEYPALRSRILAQHNK